MVQPLPETRQMEVAFEEVTRLVICFGRPRLHAMRASARVRAWSCCSETVAAASKPMTSCCTVHSQYRDHMGVGGMTTIDQIKQH